MWYILPATKEVAMSLSSRIAIRGTITGVAAVVAAVVHFSNKSSSSDTYRKQAHRMVETFDGYATAPDYYNWLADEAHDAVFDDSYHTEHHGRYSEKTWVDRNQYIEELLDYMYTQAKTDKAVAVIQSIEKYCKVRKIELPH
jgi:hypothetical protein